MDVRYFKLIIRFFLFRLRCYLFSSITAGGLPGGT